MYGLARYCAFLNKNVGLFTAALFKTSMDFSVVSFDTQLIWPSDLSCLFNFKVRCTRNEIPYCSVLVMFPTPGTMHCVYALIVNKPSASFRPRCLKRSSDTEKTDNIDTGMTAEVDILVGH